MAEPAARLNSIETVMDRLGVGRSKTFALVSSGQLRSVKIGSRRLVPESALREFIEHLEAAPSASGAGA